MKVMFTDAFVAEEQTKRILKELFGNFEISENPDFLFCGVAYEANRLKYNCARIMLTGENYIPDFNCVDYAIGFHYLTFEDRYLRAPLYLFYENDYALALEKHKNYKSIKKEGFCNFIYSNGRDAMKERDDFFYSLSKYKKVDSGGKHLNNIGKAVDDKLEFQRKYKFSIAFENASVNGYTTEKILQAFSAGTIPIYYGDPLISKEFNSKAFINCHDFDTFDDVIDRVREIDNNDNLFEEYLSQPVFNDIERAKEPLKMYKDFIYKICSQDPQSAIRRCNDCWGEKIQNEMRDFYKFTKVNEENSLKSKALRVLIR
ncbi:Glycosyltransferase family 10 (fucosyltransferase) C-term [Butyrivibrio sp. Su6]|uniref:glycosyltransferase family 10 domain-containing protein n=1 Tax=Butyrivibrio sp. Su6 TaxID=1520810 RepID=UPI00089E0D38|nr:glycosyltransferase family 10 [Butyrivibrio sp. Su6]SEG15930.1 Glycosyltransferase family 10 (fucosyltransferase) C-term [Butyrivibrio sp. Su6]